VRQIVFLRPHTVVVFDRVASVKANYPKTWVVHCREKPAIDGTSTTIVNGKGRCVMKTVLPANPWIESVEGYSYEGRSWDPPKTNHNEFAVKWRVEVKPRDAREEDLFLHVLFTDEPRPVEALLSGVGVRIGAVEVAFDGRVGGRLTRGGEKIELTGEVRRGKFD
jgi:hypothetical protein